MAAALFLMLLLTNNPIDADLVIKGGTVFDGSGQAGRVADVAIKGDRIVAVGSFEVAGQPKVLDATGLIVAAGFIDLHTHSDTPIQLGSTRANQSYITQGVTTIVTGNCGAGPVDVAEYYGKLEKNGVGSNVAHQVPHNDVRTKVLGNVNRAPTPDELKRMEDLVDRAMRNGAWGFSTGLIYNPGTYSKTDELVALAKIASRHGGHYASHIRDEGAGLLTSIEEVITIGREAKLPVHISHIKCSGRKSWGMSAEAIGLIETARAAGMKLTADQYPYPASSTSLRAMVIPAQFREGAAADFQKRLADPEQGPKIKAAIERAIDGRQGGQTLKIALYRPNAAWQGKDLSTIAESAKKSVLDIVLEIEKNGGASVVSFGMNEEDVRLFMRRPWVATASDGSSKVPDSSVPHPRSYGTFPRKVGRYAIADGVLPIEQAIRSCSGLPADILRLPERGYLKPGFFADVVVFDSKTFRDLATYDKPHQFAPGVRWLVINGQFAIEESKPTPKLAGRVLRHISKSE